MRCMGKMEDELSEEEVKKENKNAETEKAFEQYYGKAVQNDVDPLPEIESDLPIYNLDDLEDAVVLKKVENIPSWKRRLMK